VYLLDLEKPNCKPRIYIRSGTAIDNGVTARFDQYNKHVWLPSYVETTLDDGYVIVHKGLLCWMPVPLAIDVPILRTLFLALEATFAFVFWAMVGKTKHGYGMAQMCNWARDTLEYDGLCSHNALSEGTVGDLNLSAEEVKARTCDFLQRKADDVREYRERAKTDESEEYHAKLREQRKKHLENNPGAQAKADKKCRKKAVAEKKHYCAICDHAFTKKVKLTKHLAGPQHASRVAKRCVLCSHTFGKPAELKRHLTSA
jgi:hypothetical protein